MRSSNAYYRGPVTDHFDGSLFFNPGGIAPRNFRDVLRWQLSGGRSRWPKAVLAHVETAKPAERVGKSMLRVTMVGHATLLVQAGGINILTDPVWSERASPFRFAGPRRVTPPGIAFKDLPPIDIVLLSHNHYDHMDLATLARLRHAFDPLVITPLGNDTILKRIVPGMRLQVGDWGDRVEIGGGGTVHFEPAHHWSARGARDRRMALWSGFVVETGAGLIYHIGDTGFHGGRNYRAAAEKHGGFRLAILPIGAYAPRWFMEAQHQNPEEAVEGMRLCGAAFAVAHHWGTFQLTDEARDEPPLRLQAALDAAHIPADRFKAPKPGETWDVPQAPAQRQAIGTFGT